MTNPTEERAGYIAGLRQLADLLEANPDVPLPYPGRRRGQELHWIFGSGSPDAVRGTVATIVHALPKPITAPLIKSSAPMLRRLTGAIEGLYVGVLSSPELLDFDRPLLPAREMTA